MDSSKQEHNKEAAEAKSETQKNSINENQHGVLPIDPPPSYSEAIQIHPYQDLSYSTPRPTAPPSETNNAISYPYSNHTAPGSSPQPGAINDKRFQRWDENATRIIVVNRLQMEDRFRAAKTSWETELLWNIILNDLLIHGYNFTIFDVMEYWRFMFRMYATILENITSSGGTTDWEYFQPMKQVFGSDTSSIGTSLPTSGPTVLPVSSTLPDTTILPVVVPMPMPQASRVTENVELPSTLPNNNPSSLPAPASNHLPPLDHQPSAIPANPISSSSSVAQLSTDERAPLLLQQADTPSLLSKTSAIVTESSTDVMPSSAYTVLPASATLPSTSVVPAVMTMPPSDVSRLPDNPELMQMPISRGVTTGASADSAMTNLSSIEQAPQMMGAGDGPAAAFQSSDIWLRSGEMIGKPGRAVTESALPFTVDDVAAGTGECVSVTAGVDNLMRCIPPVDLSPGVGEGIAAITSQPLGSTVTKLLSDDVITSQPSLPSIPMIPPPEGYSDDYGCCDGCCGDDFCCEDCYCEGGDCDVGDCGGL